MKILIATGIYPPDIGGPAQIAHGVEEAWRKEGYEVRVLSFRFERRIPTGIRHLYYFFRVFFSLRGVDFVFSPDTFSAALPALVAAKILCKKIIIRTGGDFLWEQYVERTGDLVLLRHFYGNTNYEHPPAGGTKVRTGTEWKKKLNVKELLVFNLVKFLFQYADAVIFSTAWQRDIFAEPYGLDLRKCHVVENYYSHREPVYSNVLQNIGIGKKVFVGGTRGLKWKNVSRVKEAFALLQKKGLPVSLELHTKSRQQFLLDMQSGYAVILASLGDVSPNMILEAISFGKPFILTRETGLYERLKDIALFVNPEDTDDIAAKIAWLADDKNYEAQKKKVEAFTFTHSYEEISREILAVYGLL